MTRFESKGTSGTAKFKIVVEATEPDCDALESQPSPYELCPYGPCCSGEECCVVSLGEYSQLIKSPNYPYDSGRNKSCAWTLQAPEGWLVALNFYDMQMRQDTGSQCNNDYVMISDPQNSAHSVFEPSGTKFCGELLPNYPAPSVFTSARNKMVLNYTTDTSNINRGRGFSAVATAINPLCTAMSYQHRYDDNTCDATCSPHAYPTSPPEPVCYPVTMTVFIIEANSTIPIKGATVDIETVSNGIELSENPYWTAPAQVDVTRYTNLDGAIVQEVTETGSYSIIVSADDYFPHTVQVNITCQDVDYCGDCEPTVIIELEPVPTAACPDKTLEVQVIDKDTEEPVTGAKITITYEENDETYYAVEDALTDSNGEASFEMTPVAEYTVYIEKEPYFSFNETVDAMCDKTNCSACLDFSVDAELEKPTCEDVTMTIHVRHNYTDDPISGATVKVLNLYTGDSVTDETLTTDDYGEVEAPVPMDGEYEVVVIHDDFVNQDKVKSVDCDELNCTLCAPVLTFNLNPNEDPVICDKEGFIIVTLTDEYTGSGVKNATINYILQKNGNTRLTDLVIGEDIPTNENGTTKLRVTVNGMYEVDIDHGSYEESETHYVEVYCAEDDDDCSCEWPLEHELTQDFCDDSYLSVVIRDSLTDEAIKDAYVNITLQSNNKKLLSNELTDQFGAVKALIEGSALFLVNVAKEGFTSEESYTYIYCAVDACDSCSQTLYITMEPEKGCDVDMFAEITVIDEISQDPISDVKVTITLTSFANGASDENVGGDLTTDEDGQVQPELFYDGNYTVKIEHDDYLDVEEGFELNTYETCENPILNLQMVPIEPANCEPTINITIKDNVTAVPIAGASVNLTLTLDYLVDGTYDQLVGENVETDEKGMLFYEATAYGNLSAVVSAEGYYENTGKIEIICNGYDCDSCQLVLTIELAEIECPVSEITITITDEISEEPIPYADVTFTLTSTPETGDTYLEYPTNTTDEDGVVKFPLEHMGNYTITVEKEGYDAIEYPADLDCNPEHCEACLPMENIQIKKKYCEDVELALWVCDAEDNSPLEGAKVDVVVTGYEGSQKSVGRFTVDSDGWVYIPIEGDGTYLYDVSYDGFATTQEKIIVDLADMMENGENCDLAAFVMLGAKPQVEEAKCENATTDGITVTLAWGATPKDLDLYSYRVSQEDPQDYCLAYYCDEKELCDCMEFSGDVKTGGTTGVETITYCCNEPEYYMIYVDDVSGKGSSMKSSEAEIFVSRGTTTQSVAAIESSSVPSGSNARYWLAGCMLFEDQLPKFTLVNKFYKESPKEADPLFCYNLFNELTDSNGDQIPTYVEVSNAISKLPISNAVVKITSTGSEVKAYEEKTGADGDALTYVTEPGTYKIVVSASGFIPDADYLEIYCDEDDFENCEAHIAIEMMPQTSAGTIELTLDWDGEVGPKDLDLITFQVSKDDSSKTCTTSSYDSESCTGIRQTYDSQDGSVGGETAILYNVSSNAKFTYMVLAQSFGDESIFDSSARVTVSDGTEATTSEMDSSSADETPGAEYWIAGCIAISGQSYSFIPVNKFTVENPLASDNTLKLYCHSLIKDGYGSSTTPEPFCDEATLSVYVIDAVTYETVNASVGVSLIEGKSVKVVAEGVDTDNGIASLALSSNGLYSIVVSADGYVSDSDELKVSCDIEDCSTCSQTVYVTLSPEINDDTVRIMLGWGEMPNNWDLKTLQTNLANPSEDCVTDSENDCYGTTSPTDSDNSYGAETLDITSSSYVYLVYVKNSCGVPYSTVDASHITITDGSNTKKSYLAVEYYEHETYWIVGCVRYTNSFAFKEINVFQSEDPAAEGNEMKTYCYDLIKNSKSRTSVSDAVDVKVTVKDPATGDYVSDVQVTTSISSDDYNYTVTTYTDDSGVTHIPVYKNGYYEVILFLSSYIETKWNFVVDCYNDFVCKPTYKASLISAVNNDGDVRIVSQWTEDDDYIDTLIYQLNVNETGCKTTKTSSCDSVSVEYYSSTSLSALIPYSSENDYNSYMIYLQNPENKGTDFLYSDAHVTVTDSKSTKKVKIPKTTMLFENVGQALLFGGWRTKEEVAEMDDDEKRNTLVVEMAKISAYTINELQEFATNGNKKSLVGFAAIAIFLESRLIRSTDELVSMTYSDQRNTLIADLNKHAGFDISYLQSLGDFDLVTQGLNSNAYNKRKMRAASNGLSYWIVGCLNVINGTTRFALVNTFVKQLPENDDKLLCHDLLEVYETASGLSTFWKNKKMSIQVRNATDNSRTNACVDAYFERHNGDNVLVASEMCGYEIDIPIMKTGAGKYTVHFSGDGFIGYSKAFNVEEADCNSNNKCPFYATISPSLASNSTRVMLSWDGSVEGLDFSLIRIDSSKASSESGCTLSASGGSADSCSESEITLKNVGNTLDGSVGGTTYTIKDSKTMSYLLYASLPTKMSEVEYIPKTADDILEFAGWRTSYELSAMTTGDKRDALIKQYVKISSVAKSVLEDVQTAQLVSASIVATFLMKWNIKSVTQLKAMDYTAQENALIDAIVAKGISIYSLDGLSGRDLVLAGQDLFDDEYTNYDSISLMVTNGKESEISHIPEVPSGKKYWVIGCLEASNADFTFVPANLFIEENPSEENERYCYNMFMDAKKEKFPSDAYIQAIIYSADDNTPIMGAIVQAGLVLSTDVATGVTNGQGIAQIPVYANGVHDLLVNGDGFENNWATAKIACSDEETSCLTRVQMTLAPDLEDDEATLIMNWGSEVDDMNMKIYYVNAYSSDSYTMADENNKDAISNAKYVQNTANYSEIEGLAKANTVILSDLDQQDSVTYMVTGYNSDSDVMDQSNSMVTFSDGNTTRKIGINKKFEFEYSMRGVLLFGEWSTISSIFNEDEDDQRNSLIVELASWSTYSVTELQAMSNDELINHGAVTAFLKIFGGKFSTQEKLKELNFDDQMTAFLYELATNEGVLNWFRTTQGDWYLTSGDFVEYYSSSDSISKFDLVYEMAPKFEKDPDSKENWIAGCIGVTNVGGIQWIPVGEFVSTIDPYFCHNLFYADFVATEAPEEEFYDGVGLDIIVRNSQNNNVITGATVSVNYQTSTGITVVADEVAVSDAGTAFIEVHANGYYSIQVKAEGFIKSDFEMEVQCTSEDCTNKKLVSMSPTLQAGQTRIMLTWENDEPQDIDIHIVAVKKDDHTSCRTYYSNKAGCTKISLDLDNTEGGLNGAETMTLLDNAINKDYVYIIGIEDYNFESNGTPFLNSKAAVTITNGVKTVYKHMVADSISYSKE